MGLASFPSEVRRRRVGRVAVTYAVSGWVLVQVADTLFPRVLLPGWPVTLVVVAVLVGFPIALTLARFFDVVPDADPLAYSGLAFGCITLGHGPASLPEVWPCAREAALRAVNLAPCRGSRTFPGSGRSRRPALPGTAGSVEAATVRPRIGQPFRRGTRDGRPRPAAGTSFE